MSKGVRLNTEDLHAGENRGCACWDDEWFELDDLIWIKWDGICGGGGRRLLEGGFMGLGRCNGEEMMGGEKTEGRVGFGRRRRTKDCLCRYVLGFRQATLLKWAITHNYLQ